MNERERRKRATEALGKPFADDVRRRREDSERLFVPTLRACAVLFEAAAVQARSGWGEAVLRRRAERLRADAARAEERAQREEGPCDPSP